MNTRNQFTVTNPPLLFNLCIFLLVFVAIINVAFTMFSPPPHLAMYVCFAVFIVIPFAIIAWWTKTYKVEVQGSNIYVRKRFGFVNFSVNLSEINHIEWKTAETGIGETEIITFFTSDGKKFSVESPMVNSNLMKNYIEEYIDGAKIEKVYQPLKKNR